MPHRATPPEYAAPPPSDSHYMAPPTRHNQRVATAPHTAVHHGNGGAPPQPRVRHPGPGTSPYGSSRPGVAAATYYHHAQTQGQRAPQHAHSLSQTAPTVAVRGTTAQADEYYALPGQPTVIVHKGGSETRVHPQNASGQDAPAKANEYYALPGKPTVIVHKDGSETRVHASKGPPPSAPPMSSVPPSYQHSYATPGGSPHHGAHISAAGPATPAQSGGDAHPRGNPPYPMSSSTPQHQGDYMAPPTRTRAHEAGYGPGGGTTITSPPQRVVGGRIVSRPAPAPPPPKSPPTATASASPQSGVSIGGPPGRSTSGAPSVLANQVYVQSAPSSSSRAGYGPATGASRVRYLAPSSTLQTRRSSAGPAAAVYASPHAAGQFQHSVGPAAPGPVEDADG